MKNYFQLHLKILSRRLWENGFKPGFGFILLAIAFGAFCWLIFRQTDYAPFILAISSIFITSRLSSEKRNDLLKLCFGDAEYRQVRLLENILITIPVVLVLLAVNEYVMVLAILVLNILQSRISNKTRFQLTIPTPFGKRPFEFPAGFRATLIPYIFAVILAVYAEILGNFHLLIFSMLLVFALSIGYHLKAENVYFVWSFIHKPFLFLMYKIFTAWIFVGLLVAPIAILLLSFHPTEYLLILFFLGLGFVYLAISILGKYASPDFELNFENTILIATSIFFPPVLIGLIPYFLITAKNQLKPYLT